MVPQTKVPTKPVERPADINKYGREGEKMNPNIPPQQQQQQTSNFQHRGNMGLQLPYPNGDPRNYGYPPQPYNGYPPPNQYGYGYNQPAPNYPPYYSYPQQQQQQQQYPNPQQQYPIQQVPQNPIPNQVSFYLTLFFNQTYLKSTRHWGIFENFTFGMQRFLVTFKTIWLHGI